MIFSHLEILIAHCGISILGVTLLPLNLIDPD